MNIQLPHKVDYIINELMNQGYEAYAVGGCVRDSILGKEPEDWDITTSAKPLEVKKIFHRTIDTGIVHGTVTVMLEKDGYEVTTYRIDGEYEDNRHPKTVLFTPHLVEDLKRRDFTINAMAYNQQDGLVDVFGGFTDIQQGIIRCVGSAWDRFEEDALRILRAIRFSAQLGFQIEEDTLQAVRDKVDNLNNISAERIRVELNKLLLSKHPDKFIEAYENGITKVVLPEFDAMMRTEQHNSHHIYCVGLHAMKAVEHVGENKVNDAKIEEAKSNLIKKFKITVEEALQGLDNTYSNKEILILRWTMLLHDVEKPNCKIIGDDGEDHFYGHPEKSAVTAKAILRRLKFDNETIDLVVRLVKWHDSHLSLTPAGIRKATNKIGADIMELLFEVKRADILAQNPKTWEEKLKHLTQAMELFRDIEEKKECVNLKMLAINGKDLLEIGFRPGILMGETLNRLLEQVLENPLLNEKQSLMNMAKQFL